MWKGSYGGGEPKNVNLVLVQKAHFAVRACKLPDFMHAYGDVSVYLRNSGLPLTVESCLHQCNLYMERKLRRWRTQKFKPCSCAESPLRSTGLQTTGFHASRMATSVKICESRGYLSPWYRVCTNAIYIWKGSYGDGEPKNLNLVLVQKAHFAVRDCKPPNFMLRV